MPDAPSSIRAHLVRDASRGARVAVAGIALFALVEPVLSIVLAQGPVRFVTVLRFFALDLVLAVVLLAGVAALLAGAAMAARLAMAALDRERAERWPGLFARDPGRAADAVGAVPWIFGAILALAAHGGVSYLLAVRFLKRFKDAGSIAASLGALQVVLVVFTVLLAILLGWLLRGLARRLAPRLRAANPLGRPLPALAMVLAAAVPASFFVAEKLPQIRGIAPWRELLALGIVTIGGGLGATFVADRRLWPRDRGRRGRALLAVAGGYLLFAALTLGKLGADPETKYLALSASPPLAHLVGLVRTLNDFDRDGYGSLLGENDCAPFNRRIHPTARDVPDNGVDENCNGRDFSTKRAPSWKRGEKLPVPAELARDYNVLLLTVDTVRYDHTTMGGYVKTKGRDTTPRLAELARRSVNFEFAQAPSAGTMASIPAIIVSKFFHSGIHLGPERRPMPPKILDANTTIGEVMKQGGYRTGAIVTHEYFNDWGLEQGFDTYDNELGAKSDPWGIKADKTTDKAQAWIARQGNGKWFLWVHYIDPHGRYVKHPGEVQYGDIEEDIYDGELRWTDKQIGRLLDFVARTSNADKTVIIMTSDHGDAFMEHGFINHAQALYKELQHVPLIFYVPDNEPRSVEGPVSGLDIFPTLADLAGVDIGALGVEGESLVPQLFYGHDAKERVVFAETNYPEPQRAAIANDYKLVYKLKANVYELYDLRTDPWEKKNVWGKDIAGGEKMKEHLDEWLDRVFYSRDAGYQAQQVRSQVLLSERPAPQHPTDVTGGAAVRLLGWDTAKPSYRLGDEVQVTLYFECIAETERSFRLEAAAVGKTAPGAPAALLRQERMGLDGVFPTNRWKRGDFVKLTYSLRVPAGWPVSGADLRFRLLDEKRQPVPLAGPGGAVLGPEALVGALPLDVTPTGAIVRPTPVPTKPLQLPGKPRP